MISEATKLSKETLAVLKNFSSLNCNILVEEGNVIQTITPTKNVMARAVIKEEFSTKFGIWDLSKFLSVVSIFENPEFTFEDKYVVIGDGKKSSVKYFYCEPSLLTVPTKNVKMPDTALSIDMTHVMINELTKAASVLQVQDLRICPSDDSTEILGIVHDVNDPTSNHYSICLGENTVDASSQFDFKINLLRLLPGNYKADFTETVISKFTHNDFDLTYWIALETSSKFNG
jgi:hypothetical protein